MSTKVYTQYDDFDADEDRDGERRLDGLFLTIVGFFPDAL